MKFYTYDRYMEFLIPYLPILTPSQLKKEVEEEEAEEEEDFDDADDANGQSMDDHDVDMRDEEYSPRPSPEEAWVQEGGTVAHENATFTSRKASDAPSSSTEDPLKMFFASVHSMMTVMRPSNVSRLQKQIFNLVIEMQITEQEEEHK